MNWKFDLRVSRYSLLAAFSLLPLYTVEAQPKPGGLETGWLSNVDAVTPQERVSSGLGKDALALRLKATQSENRYLRFGNPAARDVFRKGDIIVGVDGRKKHMKVREFLAYLLQQKKPGEAVSLALLRGDTRLEVKLAIP